MAAVRIVADDLTGALDAACRFVGDAGPFRVTWLPGPVARAESLAFDTGTRERVNPQAIRRATVMLCDADLAFKKIDSLLRGETAAEIVATLKAGGFASCIVAPAFPAQGRITVEGRQRAREADGTWRVVTTDLAAQLEARGMPVIRARGGRDIGPAPGVYFCDADSDAALRSIVAAARSLPSPLLWCGTAGLAGALAEKPPPALQPGPRPLLALVGTNHPVALAQVALLKDRAPDLVLAVAAHDTGCAAALAADRLAARGFVAMVPDVAPEAAPRATETIRAAFTAALGALAAPGSIMVTGGETLRLVADILEAHALRVEGEWEPGVPVSRLVGGRWAGLPVMSKSGAFAGPDFLRRLCQSVSGGHDGV